MQWLAIQAHNLKVVGSSPTPATSYTKNRAFTGSPYQGVRSFEQKYTLRVYAPQKVW